MAGEDNKIKTEEKKPSVKVVNCPKCSSAITLRAQGQTMTAVCHSCGSIFDPSKDLPIVMGTSALSTSREQIIPLGQRGHLRGADWEVVGYLEKSDGTDVYKWSEYLLFNPIKGFRWLTEYNGHWNYVLTTKDRAVVDSLSSLTEYGRKEAKYLGKSYYLFHRGSAVVTYVVGEFYWRVKQGETTEVEDYILAPEILSSEKNENEVVWSLGEYVESDDIKKSFQIEANMPYRIDVAPNQPSSAIETSKYSTKYWAIFMGLIIFTQMAFVVVSRPHVVYSGQLEFSDNDSEKLKVTPQFEIDSAWVPNIEVEISAPIQNNWLEIQADLVNDVTGEAVEFEQGIEYYTGVDSDGSWSEGQRSNSLVVSSIPAGKYHLNIEASGPALPVLKPVAVTDIVTSPDAVILNEYWPNGKIKSAEPRLNNKLDGIAKYYFEDGKISKEIGYRDDKKNGSYKVYNQDGSIQQAGENQNGFLHGNVKWYDSKGNVTRNVYYSQGVQVPYVDTGTKPVSVSILVTRDVTTWSNFFWALVLISFFPVIVLLRVRLFEMSRWSHSDFSPYSEHHNQGDS